MIKAKEKEVEKIEQNGRALIQNKEDVSGAVVSTLQELNQTWANLDHMVMLLVDRERAPRPRWPSHVQPCHGDWWCKVTE